MESVPLTTLLLFATPFAGVLVAAMWLLQRDGRRSRKAGVGKSAERQRLAHLLHDDIGQKFAAARVNLSALRMQLRTSNVPEAAELDAAMNLLDDGCRDLRTVSRLMAADECAAKEDPAADADSISGESER